MYIQAEEINTCHLFLEPTVVTFCTNCVYVGNPKEPADSEKLLVKGNQAKMGSSKMFNVNHH